jgi:predicted RND superfamily exporter protein
MYGKFAAAVIKYRIPSLIILLGLTVFMALQMSKVTMSYKLANLLPKNDSTYLAYEDFKQTFGQDGNLIIVANKESRFFTKAHLNAFFQLQTDIEAIPGVKGTGGVKNVAELRKDTAAMKFRMVKVFDGPIKSEEEALSIKKILTDLPFYDRLLYDIKKDVFMLAITLDKEIVDSKERITVVKAIEERLKKFENERNTEVHISGLPYIRTENIVKGKQEITLFIGLSALVTTIVLIIIFRSAMEVVVSIITVIIGVIWAQASMALLGYPITVLTGLIPPLLIVSGIPNSIYMINAYHHEYSKSGDKQGALVKVIEKTGHAIFLINLNTALGFATFTITGSELLTQFGVIAAINSMLLFVLAMILTPVLFSFLPPPSKKATSHLDKKFANALIRLLVIIPLNYRKWVYISTLVITVISVYGITRMQVKGSIADEVPEKSHVKQDLKFFENSFGGIMPFEIVVDTKKEKGLITDMRLWKKIDEFQEYLDAQPIFSRPVSYIEGLKFANQAFYNGDPGEYKLPNQFDRVFIVNYLKKDEGQDSLLRSLVNKDQSSARITVMVKDLNTQEIAVVKNDINKKVGEIFPADKYKVTITGGAVTFLEGTNYLLGDLLESSVLTLILVALCMVWLFRNFRIVTISLIPNIIPMFMTAGLMGFFGVPLKPSTILIFGIAFGISIDSAIHYLDHFKQALQYNGGNIRSAVVTAIRETALSMIYTSIILFFGFSVFAASEFGGTVALGVLVAFTLFAATFTNLLLLPALLISLHVSKTKPKARFRRKKKLTNTSSAS